MVLVHSNRHLKESSSLKKLFTFTSTSTPKINLTDHDLCKQQMHSKNLYVKYEENHYSYY